MKRILTAMCALALMAAGVLPAMAAEAPAAKAEPEQSCYYPIKVEEYTFGPLDELRIDKVYQLSLSDDPSGIPTEDFVRNRRLYYLLDMVRKDEVGVDTQTHTETVTLASDTDKMDAILQRLDAEMEFTTEDGYTGTLRLDHTSVQVTTDGYLKFLEDCSTTAYPFQICNHNLLLADAIHRGMGRTPILPDACAIIDEAHKLLEAARQMFGTTLEAQNIHTLIHSLRREKFLLAAETLAELSAPLLRMMAQPFEDGRFFRSFARLLIAPARNLRIIQKQLYGLLKPSTHRQLKKLSSDMALFIEDHSDLVLYTMEDKRGGTMLCAVAADMTAQLRTTLWSRSGSVILTSGTLAAGADFRHFKEETGLLADGRIVESVSPSPFDYNANCLLYLPLHPPELTSSGYFDELAAEIAALLDACWGHALVLFTSYAAMSAIKERLTEMDLPWTVFTLGRNAVHTTQQFKDAPGSVLLATGAAWEGFDFPGDCVSLLVIPRLPFSHPDALKEKKRTEYPDLYSFIRAVVVPEMQIKLKQGFGRAIRTETDTCVVAILDERAAPGQRYYGAMRTALPEMQVTNSLEDVVEFIYQAKGSGYFKEGSSETEGTAQ